jgi:hypothetical protein
MQILALALLVVLVLVALGSGVCAVFGFAVSWNHLRDSWFFILFGAGCSVGSALAARAIYRRLFGRVPPPRLD